MSEIPKYPGLKFEQMFRHDLRTVNGRLVEERGSPDKSQQENDQRGIRANFTPLHIEDSRRGRVGNNWALKEMVEKSNWDQVVAGLFWMGNQYRLENNKDATTPQDLFEIGLAARGLGGYLVSKTDNPFPVDQLPNYTGDIVKIGKGVLATALRAANSTPPLKDTSGNDLYHFADRIGLLTSEPSNVGCPASSSKIAECFDLIYGSIQYQNSSILKELVGDFSKLRRFGFWFFQADNLVRNFRRIIQSMPERFCFTASPREVEWVVNELLEEQNSFLEKAGVIQQNSNQILERDIKIVPLPELETLRFQFGGGIFELSKGLKETALDKFAKSVRSDEKVVNTIL